MNMSRSSLLFVTTLFLAFAPAPAAAALDADEKKPYQLHVVLHVAANRVFTPLYIDQVQRDVQAKLALAFGDLARVEVVRTHPLISALESKGFDAAVEGFDKLSDRTTHFVLIDHVAGGYLVRSRFQDGATGQASPRARHLMIHDRGWVATEVAKLIETSFSPVGTVTATDKQVTLTLKGSGLGVPMDRWIAKGDVFAVSRIFPEGGTTRAERIDWTVLEVIDSPAAGVWHCKYWSRYKEDALHEQPGMLGFRALRLPSVTEPLRIQLLEDGTLEPVYKARVQVERPGGKPIEMETNRNGMAVTPEPIASFAIVRVFSGEELRARLPVAVLEGQPVIARVKMQAEGESLTALKVRRDSWTLRAYDNVRMASNRMVALATLLNQSLESALESANKQMPVVETEIKYLQGEHRELAQLSREKKLGFDLQDGERQIEALRAHEKELRAFIQRIEAVAKDADETTVGLHKILGRAKLHELEADYDVAIRLYDQVVKANPQEAKVSAHLDRLRNAWNLQGDDHAQARKFVYEVWPTIPVADMGKHLDEAVRSLDVLKKAGDRLTPLKLVRANVVHTVNMKKHLETLKRRDTEDNRNQAKALAAASERLLQLHNDAAKFLGKELP